MGKTAMSMRRGMLLACAFALALACLIGFARPAQADAGLAAAGGELSAQADDAASSAAQSDDATSWPLGVYVQYGTGAPVLVKGYTKDEFALLASSQADYVSGLSWDGSSWHVTTAVKYVTLEDLLEDAEVQWGAGATLTYENTSTSEGETFSYQDVQELRFYPGTARAVRSTQGGVKTGLVFGLENAKDIAIGDSATADDVANAAYSVSKTSQAVLPVMGSLKDEYSALAGDSVSPSRFVDGVDRVVVSYGVKTQAMYRLYNPNSGEHFYTASTDERDDVKGKGWLDEGTAWMAPVISNLPVYRLYNSNAGDHHYTTSADERDDLVDAGWTSEGVGWYSAHTKAVALNRLYNPNAYGLGMSGAHHYTTDAGERANLMALGWKDEGIAWYGA